MNCSRTICLASYASPCIGNRVDVTSCSCSSVGDLPSSQKYVTHQLKSHQRLSISALQSVNEDKDEQQAMKTIIVERGWLPVQTYSRSIKIQIPMCHNFTCHKEGSSCADIVRWRLVLPHTQDH